MDILPWKCYTYTMKILSYFTSKIVSNAPIRMGCINDNTLWFYLFISSLGAAILSIYWVILKEYPRLSNEPCLVRKGLWMIRLMYVLGVVVALGACSSNSEIPNVELKLENRQAEMMGRQQVISAIEECRSAYLRPVMIYSNIKVNNYITPIIIDITCAPSSMIEKRS